MMKYINDFLSTLKTAIFEPNFGKRRYFLNDVEFSIFVHYEKTKHRCVSNRRHKHDSNMGFAKRDFTSLILKKILSIKWIRTHSKLSDV